MVYMNNIPFIPLSYVNSQKSINRELVIDYDKGDIYIKTDSGDLKMLGMDKVFEEVNLLLTKIRGGVSPEYTSLKKLDDAIKLLEDWKDSLYDGSLYDLNLILSTLEGITSSEFSLKNIFDQKVLKISGKDLVTEDFTNALLLKLNNMDKDANNYTHPTRRQCVASNDINTVNYKTGNVWLTRNDLGLGNVQVGANNYIHPMEIQCGVIAVNSVNGKTGDVFLYNYDVGLSKIKDMPVAKPEDVKNITEDKYVTPNILSRLLGEYPLYPAMRIVAGNGFYAAMDGSNSFVLHFGDKTRLSLGNIYDLSIGTFMSTIDEDFKIKQYRVFENSIKEFKHPGFIKHREKNFSHIGDCKGFMHGAIDVDNNVIIWGMEEHNIIVSDLRNIPVNEIPVKVVGHNTYIAVLYASGRVGIYAKNTIIGTNAEFVPFIPFSRKYTDIAAGYNFISLITEDGELFTYGQNTMQNGSICDYVPRGSNYVQVACGRNHSIALTDDGRIVSWGYGNGNIYDIPGGSKFIQIDVFGDTNVALADNGMVYTWGENTTEAKSHPKLLVQLNPSDAVFELNVNGSWVPGTEFNVQIGSTYYYRVSKDASFVPIEGNTVIMDNINVLTLDLEQLVSIIFTPDKTDAAVRLNNGTNWAFGLTHVVRKNNMYDYRATHQDYCTIEDSISVNENGAVVPLNFEKPILSINTTPSDAKAYVNVNNVWVEGKSHTLDVNTIYQVRVTHDQYFLYSDVATITDKHENISITLNPKPRIVIDPIPTDALVEIEISGSWVTGNIQSVNPATSYRYRVSKPGFRTFTGMANVITSDIELDIELISE